MAENVSVYDIDRVQNMLCILPDGKCVHLFYILFPRIKRTTVSYRLIKRMVRDVSSMKQWTHSLSILFSLYNFIIVFLTPLFNGKICFQHFNITDGIKKILHSTMYVYNELSSYMCFVHVAVANI